MVEGEQQVGEVQESIIHGVETEEGGHEVDTETKSSDIHEIQDKDQLIIIKSEKILLTINTIAIHDGVGQWRRG